MNNPASRKTHSRKDPNFLYQLFIQAGSISTKHLSKAVYSFHVISFLFVLVREGVDELLEPVVFWFALTVEKTL
jgi:hypothetical protein